LVVKDRPGSLDWIELERMDRLRNSEDEEREMNLRRGGADLFLSVWRQTLMLLHGTVHALRGNARFSREALRAGVLDQESKSKDEYDETRLKHHWRLL
jgi:hypothetical protein